MTDRENFQAITNHQPPERMLYYADFVDDLKKRVIKHIGTEDISAHYKMMQAAHISIEHTHDASPIDYSAYWETETLPEDAVINSMGVVQVPSGFYHFFGYISPLRNCKSIKEIENYPIEDYADCDIKKLSKKISQAKENGYITVGWVGHMFETAWQIRGMQEFLMDMAERPTWAEALLERLMYRNLSKAKAYAQAGVDWLRCGDDVATQNNLMFSPDMWRSTMLSRWSQVWNQVKSIHADTKIWYHSDGNIQQIIKELIDAGVDILNPLQPECIDIDWVHKEFGNYLTMDGLMGTQTTMPFGTVQDVKDRVREIIDNYGKHGGLIISPTHILEPEVPISNIDAFFETCQDY